jgi:hypothetical protein
MKSALLVAGAVGLLVAIAAAAVWMTAGDNGRRTGAIDSTSEPAVLSWRGTWDPEATYQPGHVVSFEGSSYVAESEVTGTDPSFNTGTRCARRTCPWAVLSGIPGAGSGAAASSDTRLVKTAMLDANNQTATLFDIPGVGRLEASCNVPGTPTNPASVSWGFVNTTNELRSVSRPSSLLILRAGQGFGGGGDAFGDRLLIRPYGGPAPAATPYADVTLNGRVLYGDVESGAFPFSVGAPTGCAVQAVAITG